MWTLQRLTNLTNFEIPYTIYKLGVVLYSIKNYQTNPYT